MDVGAEAKWIMVQAFSKMYSSRTQRGGMSLHRSLLLTLVMKAARDAYHSAKLIQSSDGQSISLGTAENQKDEPMDTSSSAPETPCAPESHQTSPKEDRLVPPEGKENKENCDTASHDVQSRKRRGKSWTEPDFLPCKKAKLDLGEVRRALQDSTARSNNGHCARETDTLPASHIPRTVATC